MGKGYRNEIVPHSPCAWQGGFGTQLGEMLAEAGGYSRILYLDDQAPDAAGKLADYLDPTIRERCTAALWALATMSCGCNGCKSWWLRATRHRCLNTRRQKYAAAQPWGQGPWCCHLPLWAQEPKWGQGASSMPVPLWTITPCWKTVCMPPPCNHQSRGNRGALHESGQRRNYPQPMGKIMQLPERCLSCKAGIVRCCLNNNERKTSRLPCKCTKQAAGFISRKQRRKSSGEQPAKKQSAYPTFSTFSLTIHRQGGARGRAEGVGQGVVFNILQHLRHTGEELGDAAALAVQAIEKSVSSNPLMQVGS